MKDKELQFDRTCLIMYSKPCKKQVQAKIVLHYLAAKRKAVWEQVQRQYVTYLSKWRTDLGGKCNYTFCGNRDEYLKEHPEYADETDFRRNS